MFTKKYLNLVVASCSNNGIGKDGNLPWRLRGDMAFFKQITSTSNTPGKQNAVIMGRKTWTSIPAKFRPLANRINIVLSTAETLDLPEGVYHACCFDATLHLINNELYDKIDEVFVIGGSSVYELSMKSSHVSRIYHTEIYNEYDCDTFLPPFDRSKFDLLKDCEGVPSGIQEEGDIKYEYKVYQSIQLKQ